MKNIVFILMCLSAVALPGTLIAASVRFADAYFLKGGEQEPSDLYAVGSEVTLAGSVLGDAVAVAGRVWSEGNIGGDILFAGEYIHASGTIADDVRLLGVEVEVGGSVNGDAVALGGRVTVLPDARVSGNLYSVSGDIDFRGVVSGDAKIVARRMTIAGTVGGELEVWGEPVFAPGARIGKDFIYHAAREVTVPDTVSIGGRALWSGTGASSRAPFLNLRGFLSGTFSLQILAALALGFFVFFLARPLAEESLADAAANFWPRLLRGVLIALLLPLSAAALAATVIGIPAAVLLFLLFFSGVALSLPLAGMLVGVWVERVCFKCSAFPLRYRTVLSGILLVSFIAAVPYLGPFIAAGLVFASLGSLGTWFYRALHARR